MLHLQSLLRNLTEYSTDAVSNVRVWDSLKAHAHILDNLPRQRIHNEQSALRVDAYFVKCCPTLHFLREPRLASKSSAMQRATLCDLLVEILLLETKEQLRDLEDTDEAINTLNNTAAAIQSASPARSLDAAGGTPGTHKSPDGGSKQPASAVKKGAVALLPIAELTISAYAALLLHALACETPAPMLSGCSDDSDVAGRDSAIKSSPEKVTRDQQAVVLCPSRPVVMTTSSTHKTSHLSEIITSRLPRQSWWLCSRVLKAFLSLQGQVTFVPYYHGCVVAVRYL